MINASGLLERIPGFSRHNKNRSAEKSAAKETKSGDEAIFNWGQLQPAFEHTLDTFHEALEKAPPKLKEFGEKVQVELLMAVNAGDEAMAALEARVDRLMTGFTRKELSAAKKMVLLITAGSVFLASCLPALVGPIHADTPRETAPITQMTDTPMPTETQPAPTVPPTLEASPTVEVQRPFYDVSNATLEHPIDQDCIDQFPKAIEQGNSVLVCFTFDNWVISKRPGQFPLAEDYDMIAGAEGWIRQNGKDIPVIIPISVANLEKNLMQTTGFTTRELAESRYNTTSNGWSRRTNIEPGQTLWITINMPSPDLANNSTQGFGFEAVTYTEEEINKALATGDFTILGNMLWPVIDIRNSNPQ